MLTAIFRDLKLEKFFCLYGQFLPEYFRIVTDIHGKGAFDKNVLDAGGQGVDLARVNSS